MSDRTNQSGSEPTPADDVRRVRERLDREANGSVHGVVEQSRLAIEQFRDQLKLRTVAPPAGASKQRIDADKGAA